MKSLAIAATGMNAQQTNIEVIANNIANINSTSYKRARAEFTDLFYQMDRMQGVANVNGSSPSAELTPIGLPPGAVPCENGPSPGEAWSRRGAGTWSI